MVAAHVAGVDADVDQHVIVEFAERAQRPPLCAGTSERFRSALEMIERKPIDWDLSASQAAVFVVMIFRSFQLSRADTAGLFQEDFAAVQKRFLLRRSGSRCGEG